MTKGAVQSVLWWLPALVLAVVAGIMPDTFLDSPYTTIPHEAAFVLRLWIIAAAFAYIALVAVIRGAIYLGKQLVRHERRGFRVVMKDAAGESAG